MSETRQSQKAAWRTQLLAELERVAKSKAQRSRWFAPLCLAYKVCVCLLLIASLGAQTRFAPLSLRDLLCRAGSALFWGGFLWAMAGDALTRGSRKRVEQLVAILHDDPRTVGALAQLCYSAQFYSMIDLVAEPLQRLLLRVKASDAAHFNDEQMEALIGLLAPRNPHRILLRQFPELPLAALKALEQIGDSRAIEAVRRLTTGRQNRRYHDAAQECLASLEQQVHTRAYHRTLLLPASAETGGATLLRPTLPQTERQPELLLRAAREKEKE